MNAATCFDDFDRHDAPRLRDEEAPSQLFNAACDFAVSGDRDKAFEALHQSIRAGFIDRDQLEHEEDLADLRTLPGWQKCLRALERERRLYLDRVHSELFLLYEQDQAERQGTPDDLVALFQRDRTRRQRVREILRTESLGTADDHYHAAVILQHGGEPEDYRAAERLAETAITLDPGLSKARWLAAAARDRYLWSVGRPQIYGTQFRQEGGRWILRPFDREGISDDERRARGVPPAAEAEAFVARLNEMGLDRVLRDEARGRTTLHPGGELRLPPTSPNLREKETSNEEDHQDGDHGLPPLPAPLG
jgi:hypothetical protein